MKKYDSQKKICLIPHKKKSFLHEKPKFDNFILTNKKDKNSLKVFPVRQRYDDENNVKLIEKIKLQKSRIHYVLSKERKNNFFSPKNMPTNKNYNTNTINLGNHSLGYIHINKSQSINNVKNIFPNISKNQKTKYFNRKDKDINEQRVKYMKTDRNFFAHLHPISTRTIMIQKNYNNKEETKYRFIVRPENCGYLINNCFKHRKNWIEIKNDYDNPNFHFKWQQNTKNIFFHTLSKDCGHKQMVNHFEFHNLLTNKANLFYNMMKYAEILDENIFKYIPFTILFEYNNENYFKKLEKFQYLFNNIQDFVVKYNEIDDMKLKHMKGRLYNSFFPFDKNIGGRTFINIQETHLYMAENYNLNDEEKEEEKNSKSKNKKKKLNNNFWLIKAPNLNRGMCIQILNDFNLIQKNITYYNRGISRGYEENNLVNKSRSKSHKKLSDFFDNNKEDINNIYQSSTIIVQKYIEKPLLYFGRKFDIRIWVLLTHDLKVYVFNEGHLKCCSVKYDLTSYDNYSHLTNYSFQKYNNNFGKYEFGNEVSFDDLQNNIDINYKENVSFKRDIFPKIQNIIKLCFQSVKSKINSKKRQYTFEIFGFDFMIDCNFEPFLIEINTNPGLEESSPLIKMLVPRMLDDALRLTVDKEFDTIYNFDGFELHSNDNTCEHIYQSPFHVNGYLNSENIFKFICDLNATSKNRRTSHKRFNFSSKNSRRHFFGYYK